MLALMLVLVPDASAALTGTGDTGLPPTTGGTPTDTGLGPIDTAPPCPECAGAARLAGEEGGSPCDAGCGSGQAVLPLLALLPLVVGRRR